MASLYWSNKYLEFVNWLVLFWLAFSSPYKNIWTVPGPCLCTLQQDCVHISERDDFRIIHVAAVIHSEFLSNISALPKVVFSFVLAHLAFFGPLESYPLKWHVFAWYFEKGSEQDNTKRSNSLSFISFEFSYEFHFSLIYWQFFFTYFHYNYNNKELQIIRCRI